MNFYYDVVLNWSEDIAYDFYEWLDSDSLELIKKIPLIKVKHKTFMELITNKVKIEEEFLNYIKDKTTLNGHNIVSKISYAALFTDNKNVIALEFNSDGLSIAQSKIMLDDEINILEVSFNLKECILNYEIISPLTFHRTLRCESDALHLINLELKNLYQTKDLDKLKYLYYEYKKEQLDDIEEIYRKLSHELAQDFNADVLKLYYIIKLSYHNV